jgi:signal transduction histidine kinase
MSLMQSHNRVLRVLGITSKEPSVVVEVLLDETPLRLAMWDYGRRIFALSMVISLLTGVLLYASLQWLMAAPLRRLAASMVAFREAPESVTSVIVPSQRSDEIGLAERELARMQETVRQSLRQREHLAALGTAVAKINHDLRNMLATARLLSDSLSSSAAPEVRRVAPDLVAAIDRAIALCTSTLRFTRDGAPVPHKKRFVLAGLTEALARDLDLAAGKPQLVIDIAPAVLVDADRDQLSRALGNVTRNAAEAGARTITLRTQCDAMGVTIDIADDGPGLAPRARDNLFRPFAGSARPGGTGLGLAIAREIARAHGGDLILKNSTAAGTTFSLRLPFDGVPPANPRPEPAT